ncbi:hypothetical protein OCU04_010452 [Sclerotinia nivalis]|uniref:Dienelactone hydrolase domain-containing protein n=1 Tax=Sclerotinia nivalis TaxID=352851 RepID=A0A9X0DFA0_9HELO|nr:hypothetical protein OCU04_010452 [Sclerotinia nivalis]
MSCPDCFRGGVTTTAPTGTETTIHGLPTYVAQPEDGVTPKGIVVMITDAFGWDFVNNRVLADRYARGGEFLVYCPDFMNGNSMDPRAISMFDKIMEPASWLTTIFYKPIYVFQAMAIGIPWKMKTKIPTTHPKVLSFFQALRSSEPPFPTNNLKVGVAGFCWGGKHTILLAQDSLSSRIQRHHSQAESSTPQPLIDCAFTAHPSYIEVPKDIEAIKIPISVAVGDEDSVMKIPQINLMKEILRMKNDGNYEVNIVPGAKHGFASRTHPNDKHEMECANRAETQAIDWFKRWFT